MDPENLSETPDYAEKIKQMEDGTETVGASKNKYRELFSPKYADRNASIASRHQHVRALAVEFCLHCAFAAVVTLVFNPNAYWLTSTMENVFANSPIQEKSKATFFTIQTLEQFWQFMNGALLDGLYWETGPSGQPLGEKSLGYILLVNRMIGPPRLRQQRVKNETCAKDLTFGIDLKGTPCFYEYTPQKESKNALECTNNKTKITWEYETLKDTKDGNFKGRIGSYEGGGFVQLLDPLRKKPSQKIITMLEACNWIDASTRIVYIDFPVYNAPVNLMCLCRSGLGFTKRLVVEFSQTGLITTSTKFQTLEFLRYKGRGYLIICELIMLSLAGLLILDVVVGFVWNRIAIFFHASSYFDLAVALLCGYSVSILRVVQVAVVERKLQLGKAKSDQYQDFSWFADQMKLYDYLNALLVAFVYIKFFKYAGLYSAPARLGRTLTISGPHIFSATIVLAIVVINFAYLGHLVFGSHLDSFNTVENSLLTMFRMLCGDCVFEDLKDAHDFLGPVYFLSYVFVIFFVAVNFFFAVINDTYAVVTDTMKKEKLVNLADRIINTQLLAHCVKVFSKMPSVARIIFISTLWSPLIGKLCLCCKCCATRDAPDDETFKKTDADIDAELWRRIGLVEKLLTQLELKVDQAADGFCRAEEEIMARKAAFNQLLMALEQFKGNPTEMAETINAALVTYLSSPK